jgi:hypothetical protein
MQPQTLRPSCGSGTLGAIAGAALRPAAAAGAGLWDAARAWPVCISSTSSRRSPGREAAMANERNLGLTWPDFRLTFRRPHLPAARFTGSG